MRRHIVRVASARVVASLAAVILLSLLVGTLAVQAVIIPQSNAATPPQPTDLTAFRRSGQTFLTWSEQADLTAEGNITNATNDDLVAPGDPHLRPGSRAIGAGVTSDVASDIDGDPRVGSWDVGCDQFTP